MHDNRRDTRSLNALRAERIMPQQGGVYCRIGFLGHEDLAPVYASADVHVSCSHFETLGNTGDISAAYKTLAAIQYPKESPSSSPQWISLRTPFHFHFDWFRRWICMPSMGGCRLLMLVTSGFVGLPFCCMANLLMAIRCLLMYSSVTRQLCGALRRCVFNHGQWGLECKRVGGRLCF